MFHLAKDIAIFAHLFIKFILDTIVDHLALTYNIKSKEEPGTNRIKIL